MTSPLLAALRQARGALEAAGPLEGGDLALSRRLTREIDEAVARLDGRDPERDLVAIICHDLRDPLSSIIMGTGFLKKTIPEEETSAVRVVDAIARSAQKMTQVVGDFHDLAKLEAGTLAMDARPTDLTAAVRAAVELYEAPAKQKGVGLELDTAAERMSARCDRARVIQAVSKLLTNAIHFTPSGGKIQVRVFADGERVRVSIRDSGRGIEPERIPAIFDHAANARRTPRDGPGLGLAIVRGIIELQGGDISVESRLGEGTLFTFGLPRA